MYGRLINLDEHIKNLDNWTDEATKQMLQNVVKRKRKFDKFEKRHLIFLWLTIFSFTFYGIFLYTKIFMPYSYSASMMFSAFLSNSYNVYFIVVSFSLYGYLTVLKKKVDKYEKEYHALRCEIIDKAPDLWKGEAWEKRHLVFEMMKKQYDINLYHENK